MADDERKWSFDERESKVSKDYVIYILLGLLGAGLYWVISLLRILWLEGKQ